MNAKTNLIYVENSQTEMIEQKCCKFIVNTGVEIWRYQNVTTNLK